MRLELRGQEKTAASLSAGRPHRWHRSDELVSRTRLLTGRILTPAYVQVTADGWSRVLAYAVDELATEVDFTLRGYEGSKTALCHAAQEGRAHVVEWLIARGADVNKGSLEDGSSPLWNAAMCGFVRCAHILLQAGARVDAKKRDSGNTPLAIAAQNGHLTMVSLLLAAGADVEATNNSQLAPLYIALGMGRLDCVAAFLAAGATCDNEMAGYVLAGAREQGFSTEDQQLRAASIVCGREMSGMLRGRGETAMYYDKMRSHERVGERRSALRFCALAAEALEREMGGDAKMLVGGQMQLNGDFEQLACDARRLQHFVYGPPGCDINASVWQRVEFFKDDVQPSALQFGSHVLYEDMVVRFGGYDFLNHSTKNPVDKPGHTDAWLFDINTRLWSRKAIAGGGPGPRARHTAVEWGGYMWLWGGHDKNGAHDRRMYRLKLGGDAWDALAWETVKVKHEKKDRSRPPGREGHAACVHGGKMYVLGGSASRNTVYGDLWEFDFGKVAWKKLSEKGCRPRHSHNMWYARGALWTYGGEENVGRTSNMYVVRTIGALQKFTLEDGQWTSLSCFGDDPGPLMEYTVIPIRNGLSEPSSVLLWGGYFSLPTEECNAHMKNVKAAYGSHEGRAPPYVKQLVRFDLDLGVWTDLTLLGVKTRVCACAQSFGFELSSGGGGGDATDGGGGDAPSRLLIGRGYGFTGGAKRGGPAGESLSADMKRQLGIDATADPMMTPAENVDIFEVQCPNVRTSDALADNLAARGWAWDLFHGEVTLKTPHMINLGWGSPTRYKSSNKWSDEDFVAQGDSGDLAAGSAKLGLRVLVQGLSGRPELNGLDGRVGPFDAARGRYAVWVFPCDRVPEKKSLVWLKPANLRFAPQRSLAIDEIQGMMGASPRMAPYIFVYWLSGDPKEGRVNMDEYQGPISAEAAVMVRTVASNSRDSALSLFHPTATRSKPLSDDERRFVEWKADLRRRDATRVLAWHAALQKHEAAHPRVDVPLLVRVSIDSLPDSSPVRRTLRVSPKLSLQQLHQQVLVPAIGWSSRYHAYAFRRAFVGQVEVGQRVDFEEARRNLAEEVWIGPRKSSALDYQHLPLFVGGAMADDRKVTLRALMAGAKPGETRSFVYVQDLGAWWQHTVEISLEPNAQLDGAAELLEGRGGCPPEDCHMGSLAETCQQLMGQVPYEPEESQVQRVYSVMGYRDPSDAEWWSLLNAEVRNKENVPTSGNPMRFDLAQRQRALQLALQRVARSGDEINLFSTFSTYHGRATAAAGTVEGFEERRTDPTKFCAVCGSTAALRVCKACRGIAYCCPAHQKQHWKKHKAACLRKRAEMVDG